VAYSLVTYVGTGASLLSLNDVREFVGKERPTCRIVRRKRAVREVDVFVEGERVRVYRTCCTRSDVVDMHPHARKAGAEARLHPCTYRERKRLAATVPTECFSNIGVGDAIRFIVQCGLSLSRDRALQHCLSSHHAN